MRACAKDAVKAMPPRQRFFSEWALPSAEINAIPSRLLAYLHCVGTEPRPAYPRAVSAFMDAPMR
jgi:hypothetical protein